MERKNLVVSVFGLEFDYWNYYGQQLTQIYLLMSLVCLHLFAISVRPSRNNSLTSVFTFWLYQKSCRLNVKVLFSTIFSKMYLQQNKYLRLNQKVQIDRPGCVSFLKKQLFTLLITAKALPQMFSMRICIRKSVNYCFPLLPSLIQLQLESYLHLSTCLFLECFGIL